MTSASTNTPSFVTATLPPTVAPLPTSTLLPPSPVPTNIPIQGTTTTQVNVRIQTNTASESLSIIPAFSQVQIIGKESTGNWLQVIHENKVGWVRAEFVQVETSDKIAVVEIESGGGSGRSGVVISGINVRNGAGTEYESIGVLTQKDVVLITGKDASGAWVQIRFLNEVGWVATEFLQIENVVEIPVVNALPTQSVVVSETPLALAPIAVLDNDSMMMPFFIVDFAKAENFQITGTVSSLPGDFEDWLGMTSYAPEILIESTCSNTILQMEIWEAGVVREQFLSPCGGQVVLKFSENQSYTVRIFQPAEIKEMFTSYTLSIRVVD